MLSQLQNRLYKYVVCINVHITCVFFMFLSIFLVCKISSFQNVAKQSASAFPGAAAGNAQAVLNTPLPSPVLHCAAEETSQGFDDVGMKWQKLLVSRKHKD